MKILITTIFPLPGGGIWSFVSNLQQNLIQQGHEVDILCCTNNNKRVTMINKNQSVDLQSFSKSVGERLNAAYPNLSKHAWIYNVEFDRYCFELGVSQFDLSKYDLIHAQDVMTATAISRIKPPKIPLVTSVHGFLAGAIFNIYKTNNRDKKNTEIWNTFELQYYARLEQIGYQCSDHIHTSSNWMRNIIHSEYSIPLNKVSTFKYGVHLKEFTQIPRTRSLKQDNEKKIILSISRLVYLKGLEYLLDALSQLKKDRDDWECWILGEGELEKELKEKSKDLGLTSEVTFWGNTNQVKEILASADMLVLPSLQENQPFAVIEAQLMGIPTIVSDAGGLPEMVVDGENGFVVEKANSKQLYMKMNQLLTNRSLRDQMSTNAKVWGQSQWDVNVLSKNMVGLYKMVLRKGSS